MDNKRLAADLKPILASLSYDGWIYTHPYIKRALFPNEEERLHFHPEIMIWSFEKVQLKTTFSSL